MLREPSEIPLFSAGHPWLELALDMSHQTKG